MYWRPTRYRTVIFALAVFLMSSPPRVERTTGMCKLSHPIIIRSHPYQNLFDRLE